MANEFKDTKKFDEMKAKNPGLTGEFDDPVLFDEALKEASKEKHWEERKAENPELEKEFDSPNDFGAAIDTAKQNSTVVEKNQGSIGADPVIIASHKFPGAAATFLSQPDLMQHYNKKFGEAATSKELTEMVAKHENNPEFNKYLSEPAKKLVRDIHVSLSATADQVQKHAISNAEVASENTSSATAATTDSDIQKQRRLSNATAYKFAQDSLFDDKRIINHLINVNPENPFIKVKFDDVINAARLDEHLAAAVINDNNFTTQASKYLGDEGPKKFVDLVNKHKNDPDFNSLVNKDRQTEIIAASNQVNTTNAKAETAQHTSFHAAPGKSSDNEASQQKRNTISAPTPQAIKDAIVEKVTEIVNKIRPTKGA